MLSVFACLLFTHVSHAGWGDILKSIQKTLEGGGGGLSQDKISKGLKEALRLGAVNAVEKVSIFNGYYANPEIRIPLPESILKVEKILRSIGFGYKVDAFEESMNRAAEKAAPAAGELFLEAIKGITFDDASRILKGNDNEATIYLKEKTWNKLIDMFQPIVHQAMGSVGVTRQYQEIESKINNLPFGGKSLNLVDIDQYVSENALDGLFLMLEKEEKKIRTDPAARVTDLLKEVFGSKLTEK